jgi:pyruvyltransferase
MKQINFYHYPHPTNVGDNLTPHILRFYRKDIDFVRVKEQADNKLLMVGSIMRVVKPGDTILGTGVMRETDTFHRAKNCKFLAVRGKLSRKILMRSGCSVPEVYGDPAVLMPLIYSPEIQKTHEVALIPHFVDAELMTEEMCQKLAKGRTYKVIDVLQDYESFVNELLTCESVVSSSLHGIILAEAYGLGAEWVVLSEKVIGAGFKFRDYLTGTEREAQEPGIFPKLKKSVLNKMQKNLIEAIGKL